MGIYEAKTHLSRYVRRVAAGDEEVVIASAGTPLVKMIAYTSPASPRRPGLLESQITIGSDFDELPPGFEEIAPGGP